VKDYFLLSGESAWAAVNSMWASIMEHDYLPDEVVLFAHPRHKDVARLASKGLESILNGYGRNAPITLKIVPESDLVKGAESVVVDQISKAKEEGHEVALDITPARKSLAVPSILPPSTSSPDHIFYLYLKDLRHADRPYPLLPHFLHEPHDFRGDNDRPRS
jgi:hypothetical protein